MSTTIKSAIQSGSFKSDNTLVGHILGVMESWPRIIPFSYYKPIMPSFELLESSTNDDLEVQDLVERFNPKFVGYHCDHECCKDEVNLRTLSIVSILSSPEYLTYDKQMNDIAELINRIQKEEETSDYQFDDEISAIENASDNMIALIQSINNRIIAINSNVITCEHCEAMVRKYNLIKQTIDSKRGALADTESIGSIDELTGSNGEPPQTNVDPRISLFVRWLNTNHPNATRIEITKNFKIAYRRHFGEALKIEDMAELFRSTGSWLVNHNANKWYAVKKP